MNNVYVQIIINIFLTIISNLLLFFMNKYFLQVFNIELLGFYSNFSLFKDIRIWVSYCFKFCIL